MENNDIRNAIEAISVEIFNLKRKISNTKNNHKTEEKLGESIMKLEEAFHCVPNNHNFAQMDFFTEKNKNQLNLAI